jgi:hypothetical protein
MVSATRSASTGAVKHRQFDAGLMLRDQSAENLQPEHHVAGDHCRLCPARSSIPGAGHQSEQAEMSTRAGAEHLGAQLAVAGRQVDLGVLGLAPPPQRALDRKGVGGVADHLGVSHGADDPVLAHRANRVTGAQRRNRRHLHAGESGREQLPQAGLDDGHAPRIRRGRLDEPVVLPAAHHVGGRNPARTRLGYRDQQRLQVGRRQVMFERFPGARGQAAPDPVRGMGFAARHRVTVADLRA